MKGLEYLGDVDEGVDVCLVSLHVLVLYQPLDLLLKDKVLIKIESLQTQSPKRMISEKVLTEFQIKSLHRYVNLLIYYCYFLSAT